MHSTDSKSLLFNTYHDAECYDTSTERVLQVSRGRLRCGRLGIISLSLLCLLSLLGNVLLACNYNKLKNAPDLGRSRFSNNCSILNCLMDSVDGLRQVAWDMITLSNIEFILTTAAAIRRSLTISGNPLTVAQ